MFENWVKRCSFTHNQYLEEVEKYVKPGSVAEKKAYFEAQHKKSSPKKAALLLEQQNAAVDESSDSNMMNKNNDHSTINSESTGSSYIGIEEMQREEEELDVTKIIDDSQRKSEFTKNGSYGGTRVKPVIALQPIATDESAPTSRKNGQVLIDRKQSNPKSCLMSIKFFSHREETKKTSSPILEKIVNSRLVRSITKTSRDSKVQQTSALASVGGISKRPETPLRENRRDRAMLDQSLCRSRKEEGESLSHSCNRESINKHGNIVCSPTVVSPFTLRSEERAAKRREFFQKLEQKLNTKEAEKEQRQAKPKEKATSSSKVVLTSRAKPNVLIHQLRAESNASIHRERESSSNQMKKLPRQPCLPKFSGNQVSEVQDKKPRKRWSLSGKPEGSKDVKRENNLPNHFPFEGRSDNPKSFISESIPCSPKFSGKQVSEVQDKKPRKRWRVSGLVLLQIYSSLTQIAADPQTELFPNI